MSAETILKDHRKRIDQLDREIMALFRERYEIVREVGHIKTDEKLDIYQTRRVDDVLDKVGALAVENRLSPHVFRHIYTLLIDYAHVIEQEVYIRKTQ